MSTDSEIVARSRDDPPVFGEIFDRHAPRIHRYLARRTSAAVADAVLAEAFLVALERRGTYDLAREDAAAWLFGTSTNLPRRYHRPVQGAPSGTATQRWAGRCGQAEPYLTRQRTRRQT